MSELIDKATRASNPAKGLVHYLDRLGKARRRGHARKIALFERKVSKYNALAVAAAPQPARVSASGAATNTDISLLLDLPDDPRLRVLVGVPLDDHRALAASCRSLRAVMHAPQFLRARKQWRFAERRVVYVKDHTISVHRDPADNILEVCVAGNVIASISGMTDGSWSPYAGAAVPAGLVRYAPGSVILG